LLCSVALNGRAYERALVYAEALSARHLNVDMQSARRWECLAALGRRAEAEQAWAACLRLTANDPPAVPAVSRAYAGFEAWRAARERAQSTS
jgi:hypothetical protein